MDVDEKVRESVRLATLKTDTIRLAASDPGLAGKMKVDIDDPTQTVSWYIRFNLALDTESVSRKTMRVAETNGYILDTEISYSAQDKAIRLEPREMYEQNAFYILYISGKVKSEKGNPLRKKIHILFKLTDNRISEFRMLKPTEKVPKPRKKPAHLRRPLPPPNAPKAFTQEKKIAKSVEKGKLPFAGIKVNIWVAVAGIAVMGISLGLMNMYAAMAGIGICVLGLIIVAVQLAKPSVRSVIAYNRGAALFNAGKYAQADKVFEQALLLDETNELAEYAARKVKYFED